VSQLKLRQSERVYERESHSVNRLKGRESFKRKYRR